jgi:hypothetical protein
MTLRSCYRATCDAPGCAAAEMLALARAGHARAELEALGWTVIPHREPPQSGAPRILYACPRHRGWTPVEIRRAAMLWMLRERGANDCTVAALVGLTPGQVAEIAGEYERCLVRRVLESANWQEPWAQRLRAAGAIR